MPYTGKAAQAAQAAAQTTHGTGDSHHQWRPAGGCCAHHLQILSNFNGQAQKGPRNACGTNLRRVGPSEPSIGWKNAQQQHNSATDPRMFGAFHFIRPCQADWWNPNLEFIRYKNDLKCNQFRQFINCLCLMKFKTQKSLLKKQKHVRIFSGYLQIKKWQIFHCISTAYMHAKMENGKETRVSTTSCVFEYFISINNFSKNKRNEEILKNDIYFNFTRG